MPQDSQTLHGKDFDDLAPGEERRIELREDQLVVTKELRDVGEVVIRTVVEEIPAQIEIEELSEHVEVEHEPVGEPVNERRQPWEEEDGDLIVPIYEEQVVVSKRLVLRERLRVRRIKTPNRQLLHDTLQRERVVVEDPQHTGLLHETQPTDDQQNSDEAEPADANVLRRIVTKALE